MTGGSAAFEDRKARAVEKADDCSSIGGPVTEIVLSAEAGIYKALSRKPSYFTGWWASRALGDDSLGDEDREMALAAYSRSFDVQMGTTKGMKGGIRPGFPNSDGGDFLRKAEARRVAEADANAKVLMLADDGTLFSLAEMAQ